VCVIVLKDKENTGKKNPLDSAPKKCTKLEGRREDRKTHDACELLEHGYTFDDSGVLNFEKNRTK
jgi:hypothetical protein